MRKQKNIHWEAKLRHQHRRISLFAFIHCWLKGFDGLVFTHSDLATVLPVKRSIRKAHIDEFAENMRKSFPFFVHSCSKRPYKFIACFVSRRLIEDIPPNDQTSIQRQIEMLREKGVQVEAFSIEGFSIWKDLLKALKANSVAKGAIPKASLMNDPGVRP